MAGKAQTPVQREGGRQAGDRLRKAKQVSCNSGSLKLNN